MQGLSNESIYDTVSDCLVAKFNQVLQIANYIVVVFYNLHQSIPLDLGIQGLSFIYVEVYPQPVLFDETTQVRVKHYKGELS